MSFKAVKWALRVPNLSPAHKLVLCALADHVGAEPGDVTCYPSVTTLSELTGLNRKTVLSALAALQERGLIADTGERRGHTLSVKVFRLCPQAVPKTGRVSGPESGIATEASYPEKGTAKVSQNRDRMEGEAVHLTDASSTENGTGKRSHRREANRRDHSEQTRKVAVYEDREREASAHIVTAANSEQAEKKRFIAEVLTRKPWLWWFLCRNLKAKRPADAYAYAARTLAVWDADGPGTPPRASVPILADECGESVAHASGVTDKPVYGRRCRNGTFYVCDPDDPFGPPIPGEPPSRVAVTIAPPPGAPAAAAAGPSAAAAAIPSREVRA